MPTAISNSNPPMTFQAVWNATNQHLAETFLEKVTHTVFYYLNKFIVGLIIPAIKKDEEEVKEIAWQFERLWGPNHEYLLNSFLKNHFTPSPIEVTTPDGVKLRGTFFKNAAARESAPTVIFYQANSMISKQGGYDWVMTQAALQEFPYNFVYFDYRACGESEKVLPKSEKDFFLDGESIYQFVKDKLQVPPQDIHFYGWSLGGGISSNVKKMSEERKGRYVNERSFNLISNVVKNFLPMISIPLLNPLKSILIPAVCTVATTALSALNWNIDAVEAIEKLKGKTLVVHHPQDELMREEANLFQSLFQRGIAPSDDIQELNLDGGPNRPYFIHGAPLEMFAYEDFNPQHEIAEFLFSSNSSYSERILNRFATASPEFKNRVFALISRMFQHGGRYWGSAEDAFYNRNGQSMTDEMRVRAITQAKFRVIRPYPLLPESYYVSNHTITH